MIVCFDCDGTLITMRDAPRYDVIDLARWFLAHGHRVYVWSGGGVSHAEHWARRLFGKAMVEHGEIAYSEKTEEAARGIAPDLTVDDEFVTLGKLNLKV